MLKKISLYFKNLFFKDITIGIINSIYILCILVSIASFSNIPINQFIYSYIISSLILLFFNFKTNIIPIPSVYLLIVSTYMITTYSMYHFLLSIFIASFLVLTIYICKCYNIKNYIPSSYILGFSIGAIFLVLKDKLKIVFKITDFSNISNISITLLIIFLVMMCILIFLERFKKLPSYLIMIGLSIVITYYFKLNDFIKLDYSNIVFYQTIKTIPINEYIPIIIYSIYIAIFIMYDYLNQPLNKHNKSSYMLDMSLSNIVASISGGCVVTKKININNTIVASLVSFSIIILYSKYALSFSKYLTYFASLIIITHLLIKSINKSFIKRIFKSKIDFLIFIVSLIFTILNLLHIGLFICIFIYALYFMKKVISSSNIEFIKYKYENEDILYKVELPNYINIYKINGLFFSEVAQNLLNDISSLDDSSKIIILDMTNASEIDFFGCEFIKKIKLLCEKNNSCILLCGCNPHLLNKFKKYKIITSFEDSILSKTQEEAIDKGKNILSSFYERALDIPQNKTH